MAIVVVCAMVVVCFLFRSRGRPKFTIPILYEDDPNDLSDYGIGSNSSKANSVKDADTDDSSSFLVRNTSKFTFFMQIVY